MGPTGDQGPRGFAGQRRQYVVHEHFHLYQRITVVQDEVPRDVIEDELKKALRGKLFGHVWRPEHHLYQRVNHTDIDSRRTYQAVHHRDDHLYQRVNHTDIDSRRTYNAIHQQDDHLYQRVNVEQKIWRPTQIYADSTHLHQRTNVSQTVLRPNQVFPETSTQTIDLSRLRWLEERVRVLELAAAG